MPLSATAYAKINLALHVTGRRADGYHLLDSLVVFTELGDRVTVHRLPDALHDVFASPASVREAAGAATLTWLGAYAPPSATEAESGAPDDGAG